VDRPLQYSGSSFNKSILTIAKKSITYKVIYDKVPYDGLHNLAYDTY